MKPNELLQFAMKAELKERPMIIVPIFFVMSIVLSAFVLRAAEQPADEISGSKFGWRYMWNSMWCTFITIVTGMLTYELSYL
jgi:hypothetical protein